MEATTSNNKVTNNQTKTLSNNQQQNEANLKIQAEKAERERVERERVERERVERERVAKEEAKKKELEAKLLREKQERQQKERELQEKLAKEQKEREEKSLNWKANWQEFQRLLHQENITSLYHFTDQENINSIKRNGGLYSWWYCEQNNIAIPKAGGGDLSKNLDMRYSLQDYVRLSFTRNHPMMYVAKKEGRINNPIILEINPEVIYWKQTRFSNMNATRTGHSQGSEIDDFKKIRFDIVSQTTHFDLEKDERPYYQAEVLVKTFIPLEYITNIHRF